MKSQPLDLGGVAIHRPGTVIGKALQPLSAGEGDILVLLRCSNGRDRESVLSVDAFGATMTRRGFGLILIAALAASAWAVDPVPTMTVFGDSLTTGYSDTEGNSWPVAVARRKGWKLENFAAHSSMLEDEAQIDRIFRAESKPSELLRHFDRLQRHARVRTGRRGADV